MAAIALRVSPIIGVPRRRFDQGREHDASGTLRFGAKGGRYALAQEAADRFLIMPEVKSLAEHLGAIDPRPEDKRPDNDFDALIDVTDPVDFCRGIMATREWRQYIMNGIVLGDLPPAVATRIMDHGWGKPPERVEVTGKDGKPIESITEVRRVVIHVDARREIEISDEIVPALTH